MISLRKHIDAYRDKPAAVAETPASAPANPAVTAFRTVLAAVSESSQKAVPALGDELVRNFAQIEEAFTRLENPEPLDVTSTRVQSELSTWADRAYQHHTDNEREMKEIIATVARATAAVAERDQKYTTQIGDLGGKLSSLARLDDLPLIRRSILESTRTLKECVEKMAEDSREAMSKLTTEVAVYRTRLEESERASSTDNLTKLANRRGFEAAFDARLAAGNTFSLILIDLNGFKAVNDQLGHLAGDDLLRQFAEELRGQFAPGDVLARWGGDEFGALIYGGQEAVDARVERIRRWAFGDYKLNVNGVVTKVALSGAVGAVEWTGKEDASALLARADKMLYAEKSQLRLKRGEAPPV